ncbi:unnamed protein product [Notodromas monacha]|uniref:Exportin-1 n=1 Tax=Notodromas monacha TaxID=399045 RepID=A0A7R9GC94_9CRUS|nr:unnamed protein product [Notodromas monacha]CAG0915869.1 unnamed protein product [Notodromas monacha]
MPVTTSSVPISPLPGLVSMATLAEQAAKLLDFNQKLDISLLDTVVGCMYNGTGDQQKIAQQVLNSLKEHPEAWTRVDAILEFSQNQETKYYALQILENVIKTRWKALPRNQCEDPVMPVVDRRKEIFNANYFLASVGIKKYIVSLIIKTSSDPQTLEREKMYLSKLNTILVQILKREWPKNWESFIPDIVGASRTNESMCQNNMVILKILSEEVFDFSTGQMTQTKAKHLKDSMCSQFSAIFQLCQFVLDTSHNAPLVGATLETLLRFLNWIPLGYVFETKLISTLILKFFVVPMFRNVTLKCLTEIAGIKVPNYDEMFILLFTQTIEKLDSIMPPNANFKEGYASGRDAEQQFTQNLALFLCTFLKEHGCLIEKKGLTEKLMTALQYLVMISEVDDVEIFKICLEYWNALATELYQEKPVTIFSSDPLLRLTKPTPEVVPRKAMYQPVLSKVRLIMISRMAKPEEVLVVENEHGEVVREFMKDTDAINLYKNMRETLVYLTHLDYVDTERIMAVKLQNQVNGVEWSWRNLNTLCWAIGSISGAMHEEDEKKFLVTVIKALLGLCEHKKGKDNKAIIASNIMYIVGQYPRFLKAHWKFLKTVVNKLFEFMHETHEGVQDMACDTFIKISMKCKKHFVQCQVGEQNPFIEELLSMISSIICDLAPHQVHTFYEAVGYMISAEMNTSKQEQLIERYMLLPNQIWDDVINQASSNVEILKDPAAARHLVNILKTNVRACRAIGHPYVAQLSRIYLDMLNVYKVMSENISAAIAMNGEVVTKQPLIKNMRVVKKETLNLISSWVSRTTDCQMVLDNFIPPLLEAVLLDYSRCPVPSAREPEVLSTMATIITTLKNNITPQVPKIFDAVFGCTLDMINKDFEEFPEHRINFYQLLKAVNLDCFPALLIIPQGQFKLVMDAVIWAFKHTMRNVADCGLQILQQLFQNMSTFDVAQRFYQAYFMEILQHLFSVVTDTSHTANLLMHANILAYMFSLVEMKKVEVSLNPNQVAGEPYDNVAYVQAYVAELLKNAYPHLTPGQIKVTVQGLFNLDQDVPAFREHLRDFLVQIKEFTGEDDSDLYLEERETNLRLAQEEKRRQQLAVPGIINPHEITEEMQD